ncbi:hypothetical protein F4802DRAFT_594357 [Xylaria palmicola]|nr:hypothetical protein F4802DRAFT_594357 [Xylaria palmicola]
MAGGMGFGEMGPVDSGRPGDHLETSLTNEGPGTAGRGSDKLSLAARHSREDPESTALCRDVSHCCPHLLWRTWLQCPNEAPVTTWSSSPSRHHGEEHAMLLRLAACHATACILRALRMHKRLMLMLLDLPYRLAASASVGAPDCIASHENPSCTAANGYLEADARSATLHHETAMLTAFIILKLCMAMASRVGTSPRCPSAQRRN